MITDMDVSDYLDTQSDFDLELFAYRSLQDNGIEAVHAGWYTDPVTGIPRQFDIRAHAVFNTTCEIQFAIECKSLSEDGPLLVSRVPRPPKDSYHEVLFSFGDVAAHQSTTQTLRNDGRGGLYSPNKMVGKKIEQIGKDREGRIKKVRDNETYQKWAQAFASADELVKSVPFSNQRHHENKFLVFVLPILVVSDRTLWVANYSELGQREGAPVQVDETTIWMNRKYEYGPNRQPYEVSHLQIYTRIGFSHFLQQELRDDRFQDRAFGFALRHAAETR